MILPNRFLFLICFAVLSFFSLPAFANTCCDTCSGTAYYCGHTCNACAIQTIQDPTYPREVKQLPINFHYTHNDPNAGNDVCSSDCGTKYCASSTAYDNNRLPAPAGACNLTPNNRLPAQLNCRMNDGYCYSYCDNWVPYTYSYSCNCHDC